MVLRRTRKKSKVQRRRLVFRDSHEARASLLQALQKDMRNIGVYGSGNEALQRTLDEALEKLAKLERPWP